MARILIIEDNPANLKLALAILHYAGHETLAAIDGEEGVAAARRERPDLILMDVQMPGMNGLEATRLLKQDTATAAIPVLGLTAFAMKGDAERILAAGCDAYLPKPYSHAQLTGAVTALLATPCQPRWGPLP
ncbi:MAG: response regulator receiver protein [Gammaproteobacteria bacterium RIFOXYA12_FULL_61_12]|nr:MAG: response regulator receiver protein [Gammaproteobacteria bacterium RIFOXYD12_FULL_61_37]OGT88777.1 MAG: response regulator receiver protein [Gammaproteobacteria bacterium RIFOXYA12_FULL_61_12]